MRTFADDQVNGFLDSFCAGSDAGPMPCSSGYRDAIALG